MKSQSASSSLKPFSRLLFIAGEDAKDRVYGRRRKAWARSIGMPTSRHRGLKPDPGAIDDELADEG